MLLIQLPEIYLSVSGFEEMSGQLDDARDAWGWAEVARYKFAIVVNDVIEG